MRIYWWPRAVTTSLNALLKGQRDIMATIADVKAAVEAERTVEQGVITLLGEIKTKLDEAIANGADPAELQSIVDELASNTQALSDAVAANTPSA